MNEFKLTQNQNIEEYDPDLANFMGLELSRQEEHIELIASENYACLLYTSDAADE